MANEKLNTRCCVVGGGPAGMMLGYLLARAGVDVIVLEKHADFLRDFRGDTIHPSTMQCLYELGLLEAFLKRPHQEVREVGADISGKRYEIADFSHLPVHKRCIAFMPQWHFLDFLAEEARTLPNFKLRMETEVTDLLWDGHRIAGVRARHGDGRLDIRADLVVGCDGRHSTVRAKAGLQVSDQGAPMDVLWMRIPKATETEGGTLGYIGADGFLVMLDRGDYWQCAFVIAKDGFDAVKEQGIESFRDRLVRINPAIAENVKALVSFDDVKLLTVTVDRVQRWYRPGLLCIGDCAHAMSPIGGVGINLAIQDAVAAANILAEPLRDGPAAVGLLDDVQQRRQWPAKMTQGLQIFLQNKFIKPLLASRTAPKAPLAVKLLNWFPPLRRIPARIIGMGFRPEHIRCREVLTPPGKKS
ncbi:Pentachlorophenol 4-monooxygenase [Methyloligella halotolerans]|uniref:Pentachlorophenol 4-monooxygenase n=1 Tax=Methyloligella halotolerans TaxID=1177755 RepID=A0A1E2RW86_9HYPH|nr:FAD-dependent oxidoreductase [Methyloligella halotolerans]ODA66348.1 Pentachlorophenol 4-monooxygenase [Methyloligella halotolerans]